MVTPMGGDIRFIPDLVEAHGGSIARGKGGRKTGKMMKICRRGQGVGGGWLILRGPRPGGATVKDDHGNQSSLLNCLQQRIAVGPPVATGHFFNHPPIDAQAHPAKAGIAQPRQRCLACGWLRLRQVDIDAQEWEWGRKRCNWRCRGKAL